MVKRQRYFYVDGKQRRDMEKQLKESTRCKVCGHLLCKDGLQCLVQAVATLAAAKQLAKV